MQWRSCLLVLICFSGFSFSAFSAGKDSVLKPPVVPCSRVYLGFSTGMNNSVGFIGPQIDVAITEHWSVGTGIGLSTWGNKMFLEGRYYFGKCNRGWAIASGFTYSVGNQGLNLPGVKTVYGEENVVIDQHPQYNAMLSAGYFFNLGRTKRNRFHIQAGYSQPFGSKGEFDSDTPLSPEGEDQVHFLAPGGFMFGIGFSFGISSLKDTEHPGTSKVRYR